MALQLEQIIHTSFADVGFSTLNSADVPSEIQRAFIEKIVYLYWDSYSPPSSEYRAVYLRQFSPTQTVLGWLYNDGADDLGRSHIPYFIGYYWIGLLSAAQLNTLFACLHQGPVALVDRQTSPIAIEPVVISDPQNYQSKRPGIAVPIKMQKQMEQALKQGELLTLFVSIEDVEKTSDGEEALQPLTSLPDLVSTSGGRSKILSSASIHSSIHPSAAYVKAPHSLSLTDNKLSHTGNKNHPTFTWTSFLQTGIVSLPMILAIVLSSFYILRVFSFTSEIKQPARSVTSSELPTPPKSLRLSQTLTGHSDAVWSVILSADGQRLISGSADQTIKVWNLATGAMLSTLSGHTDAIRAMALSPNGQTLVSSSGDNTIKLWDLQTNTLISTLTEHNSPVWSVDISRDGQTLVSSSNDGMVNIWQLQTGKLLRSIQAHTDCVFSVAINPDGKTLATGSMDNTIKFWDLQTGDLIRTISYHTSAVRSIAFSPGGQTLASASWDKTITLWHWPTGKLLYTFTGHTSRAVAVTFSSDGQTLISGSIDHTIKRWNVQTGQLLQTLTDPSDWVLTIATDNDRLVSGSKDKAIRIWQ